MKILFLAINLLFNYYSYDGLLPNWSDIAFNLNYAACQLNGDDLSCIATCSVEYNMGWYSDPDDYNPRCKKLCDTWKFGEKPAYCKKFDCKYNMHDFIICGKKVHPANNCALKLIKKFGKYSYVFTKSDYKIAKILNLKIHGSLGSKKECDSISNFIKKQKRKRTIERLKRKGF